MNLNQNKEINKKKYLIKIKKLKKKQLVDDYKINLLRNAYLLISGHPRSIEYMIEMFREIDWNDFVTFVQTKSLPQIFEKLCSEFGSQLSYDNYSSEILEKFIFSSPCITSSEDSDFRELVEIIY
jgi:hypothetical protein